MTIHAASHRGARGSRRDHVLLGVCGVLCSAVFASAQNAPALQFRGSQESKHATIAATPAGVTGAPGAKISLFVDVTPKANIHVYAPGSKDYIPITVKPEPQAHVKFGKVTYPKAETMTFADEKVPVFQKPFRLTQDATLDKAAAPGSTVTIAGTVHFQACDDRVCYPPESVPVSWTVAVK
jgi:DsbC/DsbD-like thiol-disulfide interchange protein